MLVVGIAFAYSHGFSPWPSIFQRSQKSAQTIDEKITEKDSSLPDQMLLDDDPWLVMNKLVEAYDLTSGIRLKGTIKLIDGNSDEENLIEEDKFDFMGFPEKSYYQLGKFEFVETENLSLIADHENKTISMASRKSSRTNLKPFNISIFKESLKERDADASIAKQDSLNILTIDHIRDPKIQGYKIFYTPGNFRIRKILVGMARVHSLDGDDEMISITEEKSQGEESMREFIYYAEMSYDEVLPLKQKAKSFHPDLKFVNSSNGQWRLTSEFKDYQLYSSVAN